MSVTIHESSRLKHAALIIVDGVEFWDLPRLPDVNPRGDDLFYVVADTDRIDKIAHKYYRDSRLWDVIAQANGFKSIPAELFKGQLIRVPTINRVMSDLRG